MKKANKPDLHYTHHILPWVVRGVRFGYPPCCIGEFIIQVVQDTTDSRGKRKFHGTGYVPCVKCNKLTKKAILKGTKARRDPNLPAFPKDDLD